MKKDDLTIILSNKMVDSPTSLTQVAISAALSCDWEQALKINQKIIESDPKNVDALNRLARAHFELGNLKKSKKFYQEALKNDPYNQISQKFLKRIETFSKRGAKTINHNSPSQIDSNSFIEEPGKTKLVALLKVAEPHKLSLLSPGEPVKLVTKNRSVVITDQQGSYLGVLPDDLSHHLLRLIKGGNKYQALIKTLKTNGLSVLIRELFRSSRFKNQPSFMDNLGTNLTYSSDHIYVPDEANEDGFDQSEEEESV